MNSGEVELPATPSTHAPATLPDAKRVGTHDFPDPKVQTAVPYGIYDLGADAGWVSVGSDHDTIACAVQTLRSWWQIVGCPSYPRSSRLLICADSGGSNGYRVRLSKLELGRLAIAIGLASSFRHVNVQ